MSKLASRRQKSRALQSTPCAAKRPAQDRRSWRSLSSEKPRRGNACWRREIRLLAVLGRLKDCARVYTNRIFLRREAFLRLRTRIFFALCQGNEQVYARKNAVKSSREKRCLAQGSSLPSRHPNRKNIWIPAMKLRWGKQLLPALDRGQEALDRAHRSNAQCADVCKKLRSPDGFCRGVSFHLNKKLPGKCCMTGNNVYPRDKLNHFKFLGIGHQFLVQVVGRRGEKMTQRFL